MSDAEASVQALHAKIDALVAELTVADPSGRATERWCNAQTELHDATLWAVRKRKFGTATFVAPIEAGVPSTHRAIDAGFVAKIKS